MTINLNDRIKVRLTAYGKLVYFNHYDSVNRNLERTIIKNCEAKVDDDGYTEFQLWDFINIFGNYIGLAKQSVIEPIEFEVIKHGTTNTESNGDEKI